MAAAAHPTTIVVDHAILQAGVDVVSVPATYVVRSSGGWAIEVFNRAYRLAGLGLVAERSPMLCGLADRLDGFMATDHFNHEFDWSTDSGVDARHYRVGFGRAKLGGTRCLVTLIDQTSRVRTEHSLRREMTTDSLTGLPNREGFGDLVEQAGEGRHSVLVVDVHRFGRVNACMGSLVGDELLITVARRIKGALRAHDTLARIGGDEFALLIAIEEDGGEAEIVAERICAALHAPFRLADFEIGIECRIGIAHDDDGADGAELVRHAQFAVKRAKMSGRTEVYQPKAFSVARKQFALETALRRAIDERRLRLTYQPICHLGTKRIVAFEALARWMGEDGIDLSPDVFIPVAEESGLIVPLGRWAIDEAARTLAAWDRQSRANGDADGCGVRLAVNLSAIQLQRDVIAPVVEDALATHGLTGDRFTLELTESAVAGDPKRVAAIMHDLKALGATLAMDDFGTGFSNLASLQALPIDILKIDRSFVTGMLADRDKVAIVRAVLSLAQALGKQTTAEGIETGALAQTLAVLGCTYGQGYYYARPLEGSVAWGMIAPASASATTASAIDATRA